MNTRASLAMWIIYEHPTDMPDWFVARKEVVGEHWPDVPYQLILHRELRSLRKPFLAEGLYCLPRDPSDHPDIVEVWL